MAYFTVQEIEAFVGVAYTDFKEAGVTMTPAQWQAWLMDVSKGVCQMVHRYCRVPTFDPTDSVALVTEIRNGRGSSNHDGSMDEPMPRDITFYLKNLYYTGTINGTTYASLVVQEDINDKSLPPAWVTRFSRPAAAQYEQDTITILSSPTSAGTIYVYFNGNYQITIPITAGETIASMMSAIAAYSPVTDNTGVVWTAVNNSGASVTWTASVSGPQQPVNCVITGNTIYYYVTQNVQGNYASGGDYELVTQDELTEVRFYNNIPRKDYNNVNFTYTTGYDPNSYQFADIKNSIKRMIKNYVMLKKKIQEPTTIRAHGARDYTTMFEPFNEEQILSDMEKQALEPYRRFPIPDGPAFD